jgi:hypothetical protein
MRYSAMIDHFHIPGIGVLQNGANKPNTKKLNKEKSSN